WWAAHSVFGLALVAMQLKLPAEMVIVLFAIFVFAMALAEEQQPDTWLAKPVVQHLGQASYALYMVHMPLMTCMLFVIRRTTGFEGYAPWLFALGTFALSLGLALALYRWFECPMRDAMNRWGPFERRTQTVDRRRTA
ncbi:MAG: acyltransferase family protein, partial [Bosea sp. (in: a-proteobacteria)]